MAFHVVYMQFYSYVVLIGLNDLGDLRCSWQQGINTFGICSRLKAYITFHIYCYFGTYFDSDIQIQTILIHQSIHQFDHSFIYQFIHSSIHPFVPLPPPPPPPKKKKKLCQNYHNGVGVSSAYLAISWGRGGWSFCPLSLVAPPL